MYESFETRLTRVVNSIVLNKDCRGHKIGSTEKGATRAGRRAEYVIAAK